MILSLDRHRQVQQDRKPQSPHRRQQQDGDQGSSRQKPARRLDRDSAPDGYDAVVWELALHFERKAEAEGWRLAAGVPIIHAVIERRLEKMGWLSSGVIRPVHLDLVHDLIDQFFRDEINWNRASYAYEQFASVLPDMAASFLEEVRLARMGPGREAVPSPQVIERGERVRAERLAEEERLAAMEIGDRPAKPDWEAIRARAVAMRESR